MYKIALFTDTHWSTTTGIVKQRGQDFSVRLELLIKGLNWFFNLAKEKHCDKIICAGDMFDKNVCYDEELTSLEKVNFKDVDFIVGNHESSRQDLKYSSVSVLNNVKGCKVYSDVVEFVINNTQIYYLPYISEYKRKSLREYLINYDESKKHIIISHNDIKDIYYGKYLSTTGFSKDEIEECCDLFLNGHIHNSSWISSKILNLGSFTAQNFTNDSFEYNYGVWFLDVDTFELEFVENPYSLNFYKIDINSSNDLKSLKTLKNNAVLSVHCKEDLKEELESALNQSKNILTYKITIVREIASGDALQQEIQLITTDHLAQFSDYIRNELGNSSIVNQEIMEVCK